MQEVPVTLLLLATLVLLDLSVPVVIWAAVLGVSAVVVTLLSREKK